MGKKSSAALVVAWGVLVGGGFTLLARYAGASGDHADVAPWFPHGSQIVRTLEKIDVLQRQIAEERERNADRAEESEDYDAAVAFFLQRIDALAEQKAAAICAARGMSLDAAPEDAE